MARKKPLILPLYFLPLAVAITVFSFALFVCLQQEIRLSANDQLSQLADDFAARAGSVSKIPSNFPPEKIEITKRLTPFIVLYGADNKLIGTTASVDGKVPNIPVGALKASDNKTNKITWEPFRGSRYAIVIVHFKDKSEGYVVVGKSLSEVEKRIDLMQSLVGVFWIVTMFGTFATYLLVISLRKV